LAAAELFYKPDYDNAIIAFDSIVATQASPYRAAAAYSAARAALLAERYADGFKRIAAIMANPRFAEFHGPAQRLVGTLAYQTGRAELIAAHYMQILHGMTVPSSAYCTEPIRRERLSRDLADLSWYLSLYNRGAPEDWPRVLDALAKHDAAFDLIRSLAAPTPFAMASGSANTVWPQGQFAEREGFLWDAIYPVGGLQTAGSVGALASKSGRVLTEQARQHWLATRNPLWAVAFAKRATDARDLPLVNEMLKDVVSRPGTTEYQQSRQAFALEILRHAVRLAIMSGQSDQAREIVRLHREFIRPAVIDSVSRYSDPNRHLDELSNAVIESPATYYLLRNEYAAARAWVQSMREYAGENVGWRWRSQLATELQEVVADYPLDQVNYVSPRAVGAALDMQSTATARELARNPATLPFARRALLGSTFVRLFALSRLREAVELVPALEQTYPELRAPLKRIAMARTDAERRFQVARMLLANPGLGVLPSWTHRDSIYLTRSWANTRDLSKVDSHNPNDGNWWCPIAIPQLERRVALDFTLHPTSAAYQGLWWQPDPSHYAEHERMGSLIVAKHPAFADTDAGELQALASVRSGPRMLADVVFEWADKNPARARTAAQTEALAEALHNVVRATRYGCRRAGPMRDISLEAYRRLHREAPNSEWARRTPYWYSFGYFELQKNPR
jgi:hypothetical protein